MADVRESVLEFVRKKIEGSQHKVESGTELIRSGIVDSLGILELVNFVETTFGITLSEEDMSETNLNSVDRITEVILRKKS